MARLCIFDCDGTLVDSQHEIIAAMQRAFGNSGLAEPTADAIRHIVGLSLRDAVLTLLSLDYDDTIMAAAGHQAEEILEVIRTEFKGQYILAVEGNPPLGDDGVFCIPGGRPFVEKLKYMAEDAAAVIAVGSCASWGCVQAAKPNPT